MLSLPHLLTGIQARFDQPGYKMYSRLQQLLLGVCSESASQSVDQIELVKELCDFYSDDLCEQKLLDQLKAFAMNIPNDLHGTSRISDVINYMRSISDAKREFFGEIVKVCKLLLTMPATNAESERTFSGLRRIKTWLRSTMTQKRLNHVMLLHIHQDKTDSLDLKCVAQDFVNRNEHRRSVFGNF